MKDFKAKYFEKAKIKPRRSAFDHFFDSRLITRLEAYEDLFPYINEMRGALKLNIAELSRLKKFADDKFEKTDFDSNSILKSEKALKNLDEFVGGGE